MASCSSWASPSPSAPCHGICPAEGGRPSQNWRTFLTNHLGQLSFVSSALSAYVPGADDVVDIPSVAVGRMPLGCPGLNTSRQCVLVGSFPRTSRMPSVRDQRLNRTTRRHRGGRDPPTVNACRRSTVSPSRVDGSPASSLLHRTTVQGSFVSDGHASAGLMSVSVEHPSTSPGRHAFVVYGEPA